MSKKGLLIGNSHLAAYARALEVGAQLWPDQSYDRFGAYGDWLDSFGIEDGWLCSQDDKANQMVASLTGVSKRRPDEYDFIVLAGLRFSIFALIRLFKQKGCVAMASAQDYETARANGLTLVSEMLLQHLAQEQLNTSLAMRLVRDIRAVTDVPVFLASQPRPTRQVLIKGTKFGTFYEINRLKEGAFVSAFYQKMAHKVCAEAGAIYLPQPPKTIEDGLFTEESYMIGTVRPYHKIRPGKKMDYRHANAEFGALMLDQIAAHLS
ncbi:hypothetical protein [Celeribacter baekdonensis]|uniref:Uncharacterized protein n=1 Tax=Celeribacter baekdonensis TaxID=875171 RepID=A0A2R4M114_9RHOB|nr:hypothetical protein [Celeribacter baekdonensis]AVW90846.1 hypothetical protein DA792_06905 [Celeribacter baekdonensis]